MIPMLTKTMMAQLFLVFGRPARSQCQSDKVNQYSVLIKAQDNKKVCSAASLLPAEYRRLAYTLWRAARSKAASANGRPDAAAIDYVPVATRRHVNPKRDRRFSTSKDYLPTGANSYAFI
jgi:hypothetical protein